MYAAGGDNDDGPAIALGGIALQSREEAAKIQFVVTDGEPACLRLDGDVEMGEEEVKYNVDRNRERGHLVMGVFYAKPSGYSREWVAPHFDKMYGPGNWVYISELSELPKIVTATLEAQLARHLPAGRR